MTQLLADLGIDMPEWKLEGSCRDEDPALWYPGKGRTAVAGRKVCADCPVMARCLQHALATREKLGVWGGAAWRRRRRLAVVWVQRAHDYRDDCTDPACRWCRTIDDHRASLIAPQGPQQLNGPGARCGFKSTYARGHRDGLCSFVVTAEGRALAGMGVDIRTWWLAWFGDNTERRLLVKARALAEFDTVLDVAA